MEGKLYKWIGYMNGWKLRTVKLNGGILSFYEDDNTSTPEQRVHLAVATIDDDHENQLKFKINTGQVMCYLQAMTTEDKTKWLNAIKIAKIEADKQIRQGAAISNTAVGIQNLISNLSSKYSTNEPLVNDLQHILKQCTTDNETSKSRSAHKRRYSDGSIYSDAQSQFDGTTTPIDNNIKVVRGTNNRFSDCTAEYPDHMYNYQKRKSIPIKAKNYNMNIWEIFKGNVGKDLTKYEVPIKLNEPISLLQKLCEGFQYVDCLNKASNESNEYLRLAYCAAFCIGGFVMNTQRVRKCFNPILGETFEYVDNDNKYRFISEQVSNHPNMAACYAEGMNWSYCASIKPISKFLFTGKLEISNQGKSYIHFDKFKDNITFTKPKCVIRNMIYGQLEYDIFGKCSVVNGKGDVCEIDISPSTSGEQGMLSGVIKDIYGTVKYNINGNWLRNINVVGVEDKNEVCVWKVIKSEGEDMFCYQPFTFDLNNLTDKMKMDLPKTDSRFRPDMRLLENGDYLGAEKERNRIEDKTKKRLKGVIYKPQYFKESHDEITGEVIYKYKGGYFNERNINPSNIY